MMSLELYDDHSSLKRVKARTERSSKVADWNKFKKNQILCQKTKFTVDGLYNLRKIKISRQVTKFTVH